MNGRFSVETQAMVMSNEISVFVTFLFNLIFKLSFGITRDIVLQFAVLSGCVGRIHLIPKWRPINYSFVCMLISL